MSEANMKGTSVPNNEYGLDLYEVNAVAVKSDYEMESIYRELAYNQTNILADYKTWAKEEVHYSNLDKPKSAQKLKNCNDAYTLSMWMSCLAPIQENVSFSSICTSWLSFRVMDWFNPSFQADSSRMLANLRNELSPQISAFCDAHPSFKKSVAAFDDMLAEKSADLMQGEIARSLKVNGLDSMVMTPRQVAALKLNFTEQYYVDMRQYDPSKEDDLNALNKLSEDYEKALMHLNVISHNGGFDMSVVAAEERFLVGLKIMENPEYANIFDETADVYGARPDCEGKGDFVTWAGDFYTADGHKYTTGGNQYGAFTVRPVTNVENKADELKRRAEQYAAMMHYIDSDTCPVSDERKKFVKEEIKKSMEDYKNSVCGMLSDDGVKESKIESLWESQFDDTYKNSLEDYSLGLDFANKSFEDEVNHIIDKHCIQSIGIDYVTDNTGDSAERNTMLQKLYQKSVDRYGSEKRDGETILKDMRLNYIESMSAVDVSRLMLHAATNMEQGMVAHGTYSRTGMDAADKTLNEYGAAVDLSGGGHMRNKREVEEIVEVDDNVYDSDGNVFGG